MSYVPQLGHYLYSSCAGEDVYEIVGSGKDANGTPTIDVRVLDLDSALHFEHDDRPYDADDEGNRWVAPLTDVEIPAGTPVFFRGMQWRQSPHQIGRDVTVQVNAPVGGCYRCCYLFWVHDGPSPGGKPVREAT